MTAGSARAVYTVRISEEFRRARAAERGAAPVPMRSVEAGPQLGHKVDDRFGDGTADGTGDRVHPKPPVAAARDGCVASSAGRSDVTFSGSWPDGDGPVAEVRLAKATVESPVPEAASGHSGAVTAAEPTGPTDAAVVTAETVVDDDSDAMTAVTGLDVQGIAGWVRLRRDGGRPVRFRGVALLTVSTTLPLEADVPSAASGTTAQRLVARQNFELYVTEAQQVMAAASLELAGDDSARPVHRVEPVTCRDDLDRFLLDHRPADLFGLDESHSAALTVRRAAISAALTTDFKRLTAACRRSPANPHA